MINSGDANKLWDMIKGIKVGMLTTQAQGEMHARPMHQVQDEFTGMIWFFTSASSEKSREVNDNQKICLTFADHGDETYVCISGTAILNRDAALIEKFWNPFVGAYFPKGKTDPDVTLLQITVDGAEYWDSTSSRMVQLFEFARANLTHTTPKLGEHGKIN